MSWQGIQDAPWPKTSLAERNNECCQLMPVDLKTTLKTSNAFNHHAGLSTLSNQVRRNSFGALWTTHLPSSGCNVRCPQAQDLGMPIQVPTGTLGTEHCMIIMANVFSQM